MGTKKLTKTNPRVIKLRNELDALHKKQKAELWNLIARTLEKSLKSWATVNLSKLDRVTKKGETILVPGKILGAGTLTHSISIYSFNASESAKKLIKDAGGTYGTIEELMKKHPKGTGVRLVR